MYKLSHGQVTGCGSQARGDYWSRRVILAVLFWVALAHPRLHGADRYWIATNGGAFNNAANWSLTSGGVGGASVPGASDVANFTLNNTYTVTFAGAHANDKLDVEYGGVTFDLNGYTYTNSNSSAINVGTTSGQTGRLTVHDGTLAVNTTGDLIRLGLVSGTAGYLTVSAGGQVGSGTARPDVIAGWSGSGTLAIDGDGRIDSRSFFVGYDGTGTGTIEGPHAVVDASDDIWLGYLDGGSGTLSLREGGSLTTNGPTTLGLASGSRGTLTVSGVGSSWACSGSAAIGYSGDGSLTISAGGRGSSADARMGRDPRGFGTATVSGANSLWDSGTFYVGETGTGALTISDGGRVTSELAYVGHDAGSAGRVTVTGTGSEWELGGSVLVGYLGQGEFAIDSGGHVSAYNLILGSQASAAGDALITGGGSRLALSGGATIGSFGSGTLRLSDDAEVYVAWDFVTEDPTGAPIGTFHLDGGSLYVGDDFLNSGVFRFSDGLLRVAGDFRPQSSLFSLAIDGDSYEDLPTLDLIGTGTNINISSLTVGKNLRGHLLLRQGRLLDLAAYNVQIAAEPGSEGTIAVESGAELRTAGTLTVGGLGGFAGGNGTLNIDGGTVDVMALRLHGDGTVNLEGGTLKVDSIVTLNGRVNWTGGRMEFDSDWTLSDSNASQLLGNDKTIRAGQTLATPTGIMLTLDTSTCVDGGAIAVGSMRNQQTLEVRSGEVDANGTADNAGFVDLGGPRSVFGGTTVRNSGTIRGTGTVRGAFTNELGGQVEVLADERLVVSGASSSNLGHISIMGGELQIDSPLTNQANTGLVSARNAILRFADVTNDGSFAFSNGTVDVYGDILQNPGGRITVSNGGIANFYDDVTLASGASDVQATALGSTVSRVVFFGSYNGGVSGGGQAFIEGDHRPGTSIGAGFFWRGCGVRSVRDARDRIGWHHTGDPA